VRYVEYVRSRPPRSIQKANVMTSQQIHPALLPRPGAGQRGDKIKSALKTTELVAYVLTVIGVLVASDLVVTLRAAGRITSSPTRRGSTSWH